MFIGRGTPSLLAVSELEEIFNALYREFDLKEGIEITLKANPEYLSFDFLQGVHMLGINRLSLGMQSADALDLRILERRQDFRVITNAVKQSQKAGFENINLHLIFGMPIKHCKVGSIAWNWQSLWIPIIFRFMRLQWSKERGWSKGWIWVL